MSIKLNYSAAEINAALGKIENLVQFIEGSKEIVQLKNDSDNIYPITKSEAVFFKDNANLDVHFSQLGKEILQDIFNHFGGPIAYNAVPPTPENSTYYTFESNGKTTLFPYLGSDTYVEVGDFLIVTKRGTSYNYMYFPRAGGSVLTNLNVIRKTSNVTCYYSATGAPPQSTTEYSWFVEHKNSNVGQVSAYQRAVAYSTQLIIFERTKINNIWGNWIETSPSLKQNKNDSSLETTAKEIVPAINELNDKLGDIETILESI